MERAASDNTMTADDSVDGASSSVLLVGLGDPVSDILVRLDDPSLAARVFDACGISEPGGCVPVDSDEDIKSLLAACGEVIETTVSTKGHAFVKFKEGAAAERARATCEQEVAQLARVRANPSAMARFRACFDREVAARMAAYHAEGVG